MGMIHTMAMETKTVAPKAATGKSAPKKKKRGRPATNKSAAIRAYRQAHPEAGPTAVSAALKKRGIIVSAAHVSNVKATELKKTAKAGSHGAADNGSMRRKPGRPGRKPGASDAVSLGALIDARKFAAQVGGVDRAVNLLQSLAKLQ